MTVLTRNTFQQQSFAHRLAGNSKGLPEMASLEGIADTFMGMPNHESMIGDFIQGYADYLSDWGVIPTGPGHFERAYKAAQENIRAGIRQTRRLPHEHLRRYIGA